MYGVNRNVPSSSTRIAAMITSALSVSVRVIPVASSGALNAGSWYQTDANASHC